MQSSETELRVQCWSKWLKDKLLSEEKRHLWPRLHSRVTHLIFSRKTLCRMEVPQKLDIKLQTRKGSVIKQQPSKNQSIEKEGIETPSDKCKNPWVGRDTWEQEPEEKMAGREEKVGEVPVRGSVSSCYRGYCILNTREEDLGWRPSTGCKELEKAAWRSDGELTKRGCKTVAQPWGPWGDERAGVYSKCF